MCIGEPAFGSVELQGRDAKVEQDALDGWQTEPRQHLGQLVVDRVDQGRPVTEGGEPLPCDVQGLRVAVEAGWKRARNTCLAADAVSLLAAVVLYIFAAGVVRGFAFALGISTLIDLVVFFWFTHPMVSWLARFRFFNQGHRLSGLDAEALGIDRINLGTVTPAGQTVGGRA